MNTTSDWIRKLLSTLPAKALITDEGVETFKVLADQQLARKIEKQHAVAAHADVDDPRQDRRPHVGLLPITEPSPKDNLSPRYRRAPDGLDPSDTDLPEELWRFRHRTELPPLQERLDAARLAISRAFAVDELSLQDTLPYRIRAAWRITRELGRLASVVQPDQTLADATAEDPDAWTTPRTILYPPPGRPGDNARAAQALEILEEATRPDDPDQPHPKHPGLALLPPEIPSRYDGHLDRYREKNDAVLQCWVRVVKEIARYLGINRGSANDPDLGRLGMIGLDHDETTRSLWPNRTQLIYWEECLIQETLNTMIEHGVPQVRRILSETHGFVASEQTTLIKLALQLAREQTEADVEDLRAIMVLRLESYAKRSADALDLRAELAGLKQLSIVQGLSKTDPEDALSAFAQIVRKFDSKPSSPPAMIDAQARRLPG